MTFNWEMIFAIQQPAQRARCLQRIRENKYGLITVSVPYHMFSMLQYLALGRTHESCLEDPESSFREETE